MSLSFYDLGRQRFHFGRSNSGFSTRPFLDPQEATAEEEWLDGIWSDSLRLWQSASDLSDETRCARARQSTLDVLTAAKRGLRPITSPEIPRNFRVYRSDGWREPAKLLVFDGRQALGEFDGESWDEIRDRLPQPGMTDHISDHEFGDAADEEVFRR